jgi:hypothetical protein
MACKLPTCFLQGETSDDGSIVQGWEITDERTMSEIEAVKPGPGADEAAAVRATRAP